MKNCIKLLLVVGIVLQMGFPPIAKAATYNVATYNDLQAKLSATGTTDTIILINNITNGTTQLDVNGSKTLDLNGKSLTITMSTKMNCIKINPGATLTIQDSNPNTNKLTIKNSNWYSSSGSNAGINTTDGMLFVESGTIEARGGSNAAGIGGGLNGSGGNITINGGNVIAMGGENAAGIGSGEINGYADGGTITINGGNVTANGGGGDAAGGAGIGRGSGGHGGIFTINGGNVAARGSNCAAGIGSGHGGHGGSVIINGGTVTANSISGGAGIGSGSGYGSLESIDINGGNVTATGGSSGSGIGGGSSSLGGNITISGGNVVAQGGDYGAGIGGGHFGESGSTITIRGGRVTATRGDGALYDIGQGDHGERPTKFQITGGSVRGSNMSFPTGFPENANNTQVYLLTVMCNSGVDIGSNITSGSYLAPARHSELPPIYNESYLWLPKGANDVTVKMQGLDITNNVNILSDNTNAQTFQNISTNTNYVVCCTQNGTNMRFNIVRAITGSMPVRLFIAAYDNSRKMIMLSSEKIDCPQNQSVYIEAQIPTVGTSRKIMLWEDGFMIPLIDSIVK